jgi:hypothetical protein
LEGERPNIIAPYTHTLSAEGHDLETTNIDIAEQDFIVAGENPKGQSFFTVSPQVPLFVLHDPPTDGGYSFLGKE